jgi:uncharacterized membrane protein
VRTVTLLALWVHLLGVVVWLGGVLYQSHVLLPLARRGGVSTFAEAARRQRPFAWTALALVVLTGLYNVTRLGPLEKVMESGAGLVLAGKLMLVLLLIALAAQRDFTHVVRLGILLHTGDDPAPTLRTIAWLDRVAVLLAVVIVYLGLVVSRA